MTDQSTVFTGCSYTKGIGLPDINNDKDLWVNILHGSLPELRETCLVNLASAGSTNMEIFQRSVDAMCGYDCKYLVVAWTSLYRYRFSLGAELYDVSQYWSPGHELMDVTINPDLRITKKFLTDIKNKFFSLHHDHCEILKILNYTATLHRLGQKTKIKVYFVNNMLPWDLGYFDRVIAESRLPSDTTPYTQNLLNAETRDDSEFFQIYDAVHKDYTDSQAIALCNWLNLDTGFKEKFMLDVGNDGSHPGPNSHREFAKHLIESFAKLQDKAQS